MEKKTGKELAGFFANLVDATHLPKLFLHDVAADHPYTVDSRGGKKLTFP